MGRGAARLLVQALEFAPCQQHAIRSGRGGGVGPQLSLLLAGSLGRPRFSGPLCSHLENGAVLITVGALPALAERRR